MHRHRRTIAAVLLAGAVAAVLALVPFYGSLERSWERAELRKALEGDAAIEERVRRVIGDADGRRTFFDLVEHELATRDGPRQKRAGLLANMALLALVEAGVPVPDAIPALERLLGNELAQVRLHALRLIAVSAPGTLDGAEAARLVCVGFRDKAPSVRKVAQEALAELDAAGLDPKFLFEAFKGEEHIVKERLDDAFLMDRAKYVPVFVAGLSDGDPEVRSWCGRILFRRGPDPGAPLSAVETALRSEERLARVWGIDCAVLWKEPPTGLLTRALEDRDPEVRWKAARRLEVVDGELAGPALERALGDEDPAVRIAAAAGLLSFDRDHSGAARELSRAIEDPSGRHVRLALREARRAGENVAAIAASLEKARGSPEEDIRYLAEAALGVSEAVKAPEARPDDVVESPAPEAKKPEDTAIAWLAREVPRWSVENRCRSCHNDGDGARALIAARAASLEVPHEALEQALGWLSVPGDWIGPKAAEDPGGAELARLQFASALAGAVFAGLLKERAPLLRAAEMLAKDQLADGSWKGGSENAVGSPTSYSRHLATAAARAVLAAAETHEEPRRRAEGWLRDRRPANVHQAAVLLLAAGSEGDFPGEEGIADSLALIRAGRSKDGGWGPYTSSAPEVFDTALVILGLSRIERRLAAAPERAAEVREWIRGGREFLHSNQYGDGSWLETTRPPGSESYAQRVSTTAWAALALIATR